MNKVQPIEIAEWFMKQDISGLDNTQDGNTKMQKLLFFSQLIYMCKNDENTMFDDEFSAFKNGMVLNDIRIKYRNSYNTLKENSIEEIKLQKDVEESLDLTMDIFGHYSAAELSDLCHEFNAWSKHFDESKMLLGYNKAKAQVPYSELKKELYRMKKVLQAYESTVNIPYNEEEDY